jgi:hypothetical protein
MTFLIAYRLLGTNVLNHFCPEIYLGRKLFMPQNVFEMDISRSLAVCINPQKPNITFN